MFSRYRFMSMVYSCGFTEDENREKAPEVDTWWKENGKKWLEELVSQMSRTIQNSSYPWQKIISSRADDAALEFVGWLTSRISDLFWLKAVQTD